MTDADDPWYAVDDMPHGRLHVRAWWSVHGVPERLTVARDWANGAWQWYMGGGNDAVSAIPPRGRKGAGWGSEPICWQPRDPVRWTWPNGAEPARLPVHAVPRLTESPRVRFHAVDAADETAEVRSGESNPWLGELPWWRDPYAIRYDRPGEITRRMAEGRVMRALAHCGATTPRLHVMTTGTLLARLADHAARMHQEVYESRTAAVRMARFQPGPADHADFLHAMAWFAALAVPSPDRRAWSLTRVQRVLHYRSADKVPSFAAIAYAISPRKPLSWQRVQQVYEDGIDAVWRHANRSARREVA